MVDLNTSWDSSELEKLLLFRGVDFRSVRGLLEECPMRELKPDEILIRANEQNETLYLLLSGSLRVHLKLEAEPITILKKGEVVGELSLLDHQLTAAHVVADEPCRLLVLDEETMWSLVDASPVARNLLFLLARRVRHGDALLVSSQQLQRQYEDHATTDALTGLYNRRWLNRTLERQMERSQKDEHGLALLVIDVDSFKGYNDKQGHVAGDHALYAVARTVRESLRPGEIIARLGGDEFVAVLPGTDVHGGLAVGERLRKAIAEAEVRASDGSPLPGMTISVGVAQLRPGDTVETLVEAADQALTLSKREGGNRVSKVDRP